jgi:hypothetical protein
LMGWKEVVPPELEEEAPRVVEEEVQRYAGRWGLREALASARESAEVGATREVEEGEVVVRELSLRADESREGKVDELRDEALEFALARLLEILPTRSFWLVVVR